MYNYEDILESAAAERNKIYEAVIGDKFLQAYQLFERYQSEDRPITDEELAWVLETLPMQLFDISECRANLQLSIDVLKLTLNANLTEFRAGRQADFAKASETTIRSSFEADNLDQYVILKCQESVLAELDKKITFCRELIMSSKKLWDARRSTEQVNPVSEADYSAQLPEYTGG